LVAKSNIGVILGASVKSPNILAVIGKNQAGYSALQIAAVNLIQIAAVDLKSA
jgi:hypothetical protein